MLSYADRVRTGELIGPAVYSTGPGVFWQDMIDSEEEAREFLSKYARYYDTQDRSRCTWPETAEAAS